MWRNIFIESCILSLLIFGGFYINANFMKAKITESGERTRKLADENQPLVHISGKGYKNSHKKQKTPHISGSKAPFLPPSKNRQTLGVGSR